MILIEQDIFNLFCQKKLIFEGGSSKSLLFMNKKLAALNNYLEQYMNWQNNEN